MAACGKVVRSSSAVSTVLPHGDHCGEAARHAERFQGLAYLAQQPDEQIVGVNGLGFLSGGLGQRDGHLQVRAAAALRSLRFCHRPAGAFREV